MKNLKDILEGLLRGMENTLNSGEADVNAALNADIVDITSDNKKDQEKAVELFKRRLKDLKVKPTNDHMDMYNSEDWWVQFKEDNNGYKFSMMQMIGSKYYHVYVSDYGKPTKYWRSNNFNAATTYFILGKPIYKVPEELVDICDQILRIMYAK